MRWVRGEAQVGQPHLPQLRCVGVPWWDFVGGHRCRGGRGAVVAGSLAGGTAPPPAPGAPRPVGLGQLLLLVQLVLLLLLVQLLLLV